MKNGAELASQKSLGSHSDATLLARTSDRRTGTNYLKINALEEPGEACSDLSSDKHGIATMQYSGSSDDELALIRRVAARDREAFEILYKRHAPGVSRYLSSQLRRPDIIEEALDDVMMVVWERASSFNGTSRLSTWILGIAHNKVLKARARAGIREEIQESKDDQVETRGPEQYLEDDELRKVMVRALDRLSAEQRAVIELTFYHDRSQAEIAEDFGLSGQYRQDSACSMLGNAFLLMNPSRNGGINDVKRLQAV